MASQSLFFNVEMLLAVPPALACWYVFHILPSCPSAAHLIHQSRQLLFCIATVAIRLSSYILPRTPADEYGAWFATLHTVAKAVTVIFCLLLVAVTSSKFLALGDGEVVRATVRPTCAEKEN